MKFVPARATRLIGRQKLKISKNSPTILLAAGIVGVVGTTVLASRATLKAQPVLDDAKLKLDQWDYQIKHTNGGAEQIPEAAQRKRRVQIYTEAAVQLTKLYGPAVVLGGISIGCLIKGHNIQRDRYSNMAAAYISLQEGIDAYRRRIQEEIGEEREKELYYDGQDLTVIEPGPNGPKKKNIKVRGDDGGTIYAKLFGPSNPNWRDTPEYNIMFLRQVEAHCNRRLRTEGHLFLNRVYEELGMEDTEAGAVCGWLYERGTGDDQIDFGIWDDNMKDRLYDFMVGNEGEIMLDFNVDGPIHQLLNLPKVR